ncbi:LuxR C-terminal-related transcriptional regulator [Bacillus sp. FJAT-50079]|uniref:helix-turn-helix transcriptional regulator n=1 Tax=Bacillus sp. FJAT-50079 TaxID=2833577 RepID=UPI001BC9AB23|nr:LuxR C-terminal-related transcriptional regulator [Bacillus sp. FJAT-50079]MBS4207100.1 hypothetical protein [Bacillus sp. FJAT-50079]
MHLLQVYPSNNSYHFRKKILVQIKRRIPYEAYCFTTVDPQTLLSTGAITDERIEVLHPQLFENEYIEKDMNRYIELFEGKTYCNSIFEGTRGEGVRSKRFREILSPAGFIDELRAVLVYKNRCYGFLTLYRTKEQGLFSQTEIGYLKETLASIAKGLKESISRSYQLVSRPENTSIGTGLIVLDQKLNIISTNQTGFNFLEWLRQEEFLENNCLPRPIRAICSQGKKRSSKILIHAFNHSFMTLNVSPLFGSSSQIALLIERIKFHESLMLFSYLYELTDREYELLELLIEGKSTKCMANQLSISTYTVQDHLKSIFIKIKVNSRMELMNKINTISR